MISIPAYVVWQDVPGELVLFDQQANAYHCLDLVGSELWRQLADRHDLAAAVDALVARFDGPREVIAGDAADFVADAMSKGLLVGTDTTSG